MHYKYILHNIELNLRTIMMQFLDPTWNKIAIYDPMSYTVPVYEGKSIMRASGRGLALEIKTFLGSVKWH